MRDIKLSICRHRFVFIDLLYSTNLLWRLVFFHHVSNRITRYYVMMRLATPVVHLRGVLFPLFLLQAVSFAGRSSHR
jgi:hypothetical protein